MNTFIRAALFVIFSALLATAPAFAQELKISGDAKTGIFWEQQQYEGVEPEKKPAEHGGGDILTNPLRLESRDGDPNGNRLRINLDYDNGSFFGARARIDWTNWGSAIGDDGRRINAQPSWSYAFGYVDLFKNQMTVAAGKLGGSPWGTGGPEMWRELEQIGNGGGVRVEWKPAFIPEKAGKLNAGFVLNYFNDDRDQGNQDLQITFIDILRESVIGVSYTHNYFLARFAYRLDSNVDGIQGNKDGPDRGRGEDELLYRLEERALTKHAPGLQIWALGALRGLFDVHNKDVRYYRNWFFAQYDPPQLGPLTTPFTAQVRLGYDYIEQRSEFYVKPSFYWHFFNKLLSVGAMFSYRQDFGNKVWPGSPYQQIEIEPKVQLNFTSSYIAFVYNWKKEYKNMPWDELYDNNDQKTGRLINDPTLRTQFINLRFCIYF